MPKSSAKQQATHNFDSLFGTRQGERIVSGGFKMLAHERISVHSQVRRTFSKREMEELRSSIRELHDQGGGIEGTGVLQALLVCPAGEGYRLIAGEKRFRATRDEGLPEVPCIVVPEVSEGMARLLQLTENTQRTPPPVLEEAIAIQATMEEQKISIRNMARLVGKDKGYVEERLNLLKYSSDIQEMVSARADSLRHARHINPVEDHKLRTELIRAVIDEGISEREVQRRLQAFGHAQPDLSGSPGNSGAANDSTMSAYQHGKAPTPLVNDGQRAPARPERGSESVLKNPPDPLASVLRPAVSLAVEFSRAIQSTPLTTEYRAAVEKELGILEREITRIRKKLK